MQKVIILTSGGSMAVAARLLAKAGTISGEVKQDAFPDGEIHHELHTSVDNSEVVVCGNFDFTEPDQTMELFDVASLAADEGALGLTLITPQDRRNDRHVRFFRRIQARMLSAIPETPLGNRVLPVDEQAMSMPVYRRGAARPRVNKRAAAGAAIDLFEYRGAPVLFATSSYGYMAEDFLKLGNFEAGACQRELDTGLITGVSNVAGRDVVIIGGTIDHAETLDLYVLANAVFEAGAVSMTIVIPYFGYATMERGKPELHEAVKAAYRARLISSIPKCPLGNRVVMTDLHSEGIPHYFHGLRTTHVYAVKRVIMELVGERVNGRICTTDAGRGKWAESLVKDINRAIKARGFDVTQFWQAAFALKDRKSGSETELLGVLGDVAGLDIDLFDDMIRRGTTAIDAAVGYRRGIADKPGTGCGKIRFIASHGVLPGNALDRLRGAVDLEGQLLFDQVIVTDSHPHAVKLADDFLTVMPISSILVEEVQRLLRPGA